MLVNITGLVAGVALILASQEIYLQWRNKKLYKMYEQLMSPEGEQKNLEEGEIVKELSNIVVGYSVMVNNSRLIPQAILAMILAISAGILLGEFFSIP